MMLKIIMFQFTKHEVIIKLFLLIALFFLLLFASCCTLNKSVTTKDYSVDTTIVNKEDLKPITATLNLNVVKPEPLILRNKFSEVRVIHDSLNRIKVELKGLPFKTNYKLSVHSKEVIKDRKGINIMTLITSCLFSLFGGFIIGYFVTNKMLQWKKSN